MPCLVIPDVHERLDRLDAALDLAYNKADHIVFLGDWFDAFGAVDLQRVRDMCNEIESHIDGIGEGGDGEGTGPDRIIPTTFLLGNHDCHYFFSHDGFKCSGYNPMKQAVIDRYLPEEVKRKFKIFTRVGPYLLSHAGFHEATLQYAKPEVEADALKLAFDGKFDPIWGAGRARGGYQKIGGPTWLDWNMEFDHIDNCPQIVGHTNQQDQQPKVKGPAGQLQSHCIDTALRHVAWIEDNGALTLEKCC